MQVIGVIGVGRMGLPVSARLVRAGYVVVASDRDAERRGRIEAVGARWAETVRKVAEVAEVLITVLPGSGELRAVMSPLLPTLKPALAWIDLTSTSPLIGSQLRARAVHLESLDAPMGGGPEAAGEGMLELFVGLWFGQALAIGEALLLARRFGLDLDRVRAALTNSAADSRFIRHDLPELLDGEYLTDFGLDRCCEELDAISELACDVEVPFELSTLVRDIHRRALERYGPRDGELLGVALLEELAGITLSGAPADVSGHRDLERRPSSGERDAFGT